VVSDLVSQSPRYNTQPFSYGRLFGDATLGGFTGFAPGLEVEGVTAGRNSYMSISNQIVTKFWRNEIGGITGRTAGNIFLGQTYKMLPGSFFGNGYGQIMRPYYYQPWHW
jgi:hypothetical protein